jgi:hypothetical protein
MSIKLHKNKTNPLKKTGWIKICSRETKESCEGYILGCIRVDTAFHIKHKFTIKPIENMYAVYIFRGYEKRTKRHHNRDN